MSSECHGLTRELVMIGFPQRETSCFSSWLHLACLLACYARTPISSRGTVNEAWQNSNFYVVIALHGCTTQTRTVKALSPSAVCLYRSDAEREIIEKYEAKNG